MTSITPEQMAAMASRICNEPPKFHNAPAVCPSVIGRDVDSAHVEQGVDGLSSNLSAARGTYNHARQNRKHSNVDERVGITEQLNPNQLHRHLSAAQTPMSGDIGLDRIHEALRKAAASSADRETARPPVGDQLRHNLSRQPSTNPTSNLIPPAMTATMSDDQGSESHRDDSQQFARELDTSSRSGLQRFVNDFRGGYREPHRSLKFAELSRAARPDFGYENALYRIAQHTPAARPYDVNTVRRDFPILHQQINGHQLVWFDNAATTQKPQTVIDAVSNFYAHDNSNIHRAAHTLAARSTDAFESARRKVQRFIGAGSTKEIVWVRGTTEGINFVAQTFGRKFLQPNDEIVLSMLEHHANIVPWQLIARETGAKLRVIPVNDSGEVMLSEYEALLGARTKIVALTQASNSLGTILPVAEMTRMAHRYGARVLIDGAQSIAHFPVNVRDIDCDFFVFSGHKIFAPLGVGVVYVREDMLDLLPPWQGGGNMIRNVTFEETTVAEAPARFEAGTPSVADAVGLGAALDYVGQLGMENVARHEHELLTYATERLSRIDGLKLIGNPREKVSVISFVLKDRRTEDVGKALDQHGIAVRAGHHCAQPSLRRFGVETTVRPSFSIYNTHEEIDRLEDAIRRIMRR